MKTKETGKFENYLISSRTASSSTNFPCKIIGITKNRLKEAFIYI
jgi:hypothetical protein